MFNFTIQEIMNLYLDNQMKRHDLALFLGISEFQLIQFLKTNNIKKKKSPNEFSPLSIEQNDLITGSLLGDGYCLLHPNRPNCNSAFGKSQAKIPRGTIQGKPYLDRKEYLDYHYEIMGEYSLSVRNKKTSHEFMTKAHPNFTEISKKWYVVINGKNKKIIPQDIKINPYVLAIWFCDDGINKYHDRVAVLCTDCFTKCENQFLSDEILKETGIRSHICADNRIHITDKEGYADFLNIIKTYVIWDCFKYKVNLDFYKPVVHRIAENHHMSKLNNNDVREIVEMHENGNKMKDIAVRKQVSKQTISNIINGKIWKSLNINVNSSRSYSASGVKGVYPANNKFYASIMIKGKKYTSKVVDTLEKAIIDRQNLEKYKEAYVQ